MTTTSPIGVFDSGVGGLTVYKSLQEMLPHENFVYLGDTARLPYGTKSAETVTHYAMQAAERLRAEKIKLLVIACNTASALALPNLGPMLPGLPCLGVIEASATEAARQTRSGKIAVLATEGTVQSGAYYDAIKRARPDADIQMLACNLLVGLAEEGWCEGQEARAVVARYLGALKEGYDTLVLGCTHFPLLAPLMKTMMGPGLHIVDSAQAAAQSVRSYLDAQGLRSGSDVMGESQFLVTDSPERFARLAERFLGRDIRGSIEMTDITPASSLPSKHVAHARGI